MTFEIRQKIDLTDAMEEPSFAAISSENENSNLEYKVDEVGQNVDNLSKQQVDEKRVGEKERDEKDDHGQSNIELQTGYKILKDLMADSNKNVNWPFMDPIDVSAPHLVGDYNEKIEKPIWLKFMKEKFMKHEYTSITEFVSDFRLMLENCYRYNGPDHYVSKRGQKLETMLEQKLALLSRELRAKTSITATSGHFEEDTTSSALGLRRRQKTMPRHDSTLLLNQLREEELQREREYRRQVLMDRKAEKEALALEVLDWEEKVLFQGRYKPQMEAMWELPQIGLFLFLCQVPLNVGEIMQLELERCIMMPRESSTMQLIMTSLLSTPFQRQKIDKKTLMPYKIWNDKLRTRMQQWYKIYVDSGLDAEKAYVKLGFEPEFFTVVGQKNPMERKRFHEVSFYRRVWIVKGLCDYCMQTQDYLRETVEIQPFQDQREYMLGTDADGWRYLHFPQFCGADVRIYKQAPIKYPKIEIKPDPFDNKRKFPLRYKPPPIKKQKVVKKKKKMKKKKTPPVSPVTVRQRPAGLRQTPKTVVPLQIIDSSTSSTSSTDDEEDLEEDIQDELVDNGADTNDDTNEATDVTNDERDEKEESETDPAVSDDEKKSADGHSTGSDATIPYCDNSCSDSVSSSRSCSRASSPCFTQDSVSQDSRFDSSRENSGSPMIDGRTLRKFRKGSRLKVLPNSRAARNLNSFLFMEDSNSRSSDCGDYSNSGMPVFKGKLNLKDILLEENGNSSSSGIGDNSNSCDMKDLFKNSSVDAEKIDSAINENQQSKSIGDTRLMEDMETKNIDKNDKSTCWSNTEQMKSEVTPEDVSDSQENLESIRLVSENDNQNVYKPDTLNNCQSKEATETCNGSHDPVSLKNSNGFVNITESMRLERYKIGESAGEELNNGILNKDSNIGKDTCTRLHLRTVSDFESMHNDSEDVNYKEEDMETDDKVVIKEVLPGLAENNLSVKVKTEIETENYTEMKTELEEEQRNLDIGVDLANQVDSVSKSDVCTSVKQEPIETCAESVCVKTEKDTDSYNTEIKDSTPDQNVGDREKETMDNENVKTENKDEMEEGKGIKAEAKEDEDEEEEELMPDMDSFKLIVDSVEGLRELTKQFAEPEPIIIKRGKKEQVTRPPPRKRCVQLLYNRLSYLLKELEPWEAKLTQATKRARIRLRKEVEDYVEKEEENPSSWDTDEETESGSEVSDREHDTEAEKRTKTTSSPVKLKGRNSECSTPVKFDESSEEIDISQRGRLRKRRIIPNNAEDQNPVKRSKLSLKSENSSSTNSQQPVFVHKPGDVTGQAGKILIGYSELIRQLKAVNPSGLQGTNSPILLQTSQGGKVLVTSIVPSGVKGNTGVQNLRFVPPSSASAAQPVPITMATTTTSVRQSQHPTIQHLLAKPQTSELSSGKATSAALPNSPGLRHILPQTTAIIQGASSNLIIRQTSPGVNQQTASVKTPIILKQNTTPQKVVLSYPLTPQKIAANNQTSTILIPPQQVVTSALSVVTTPPSATSSTQAVSAPSQPVSLGEVSKGKMKYYAANASTLPINVVQQLLATRGAKLQTGPNQQSILFIPMESEGSSRSVISVSKAMAQSSSNAPQIKFVPPQSVISSTSAPVPALNVSQTLGSQSVNSSVKVVTTKTVSNVSTAVSSASLSVINKVSVSSVSLGSVSVLSKVSNSSQPVTASVTEALQIQTTDLTTNGSNVKLGDVSGSSAAPLKPIYFSPPKYPTNETVRTLLFKRKSSAEEKDKGSLPSPESSADKAVSDLKQFQGTPYQKISPKPPNLQPVTVANPIALQQISPNQNIVLSKSSASQLLAPAFTVSNPTSLLNVQTAQQCVFTSISASKLNTLLLQTSAAGAKSIPSLIKLPSKAALDSAVKAVVTSVNVTLPTVNIKVPSPTSLPSIGPRRNVTKTIQTMKSPIPVAPKVVTQSSGSVLGTTMSVANSNVLVSSATLPLVSVAGQPVGLGTNLIPAGQIQSTPLPLVTLAGQSSGLVLKSLDMVRAQLGSPATVSLAAQPQTGARPTTPSPVISINDQISVQGTSIVQSTQSLSRIVQNIDGKNVLTKMIPQTILTSQGLVQGFITPQGIVIPQTKKPQNQSGVQNPSTLLPQTGLPTAKQNVGNQSVKVTSPQPQALISPNLKTTNSSSSVSRPNIAPATVQYIKAPVVTSQPPASVIQGGHQSNVPQITLSVAETHSRTNVPLIMPVSQTNPPTLSTVCTVACSASLQSPQQPGKFIFPPNLSALQIATSTSAPVSPMVNLPQGLLMPNTGGIPVASPVLNQLGFPFLQPGMTVQSPGVLSQNLNLLQTSLNPAALQQLVNPVNPVILTPGMISPQVLNQSPGIQLQNQNLQGVKTEPLQQNNLIQLASHVPTSVQNVQTSSNVSTVHLQGGQVVGNLAQINTNVSGVNGEMLKQVNAAALVKQLASSQLQAKINVGSASLPDVKPVLLQQQLNTPANQPSSLKLASPNLMQNFPVAKTAVQIQGSQVKLEGGRLVPGLSSTLPKAFNAINPQQASAVGQTVLTPTQMSNLIVSKTQTTVSSAGKVGSKTIAVNQITNEVVTPISVNPNNPKQVSQPSKIIAVNKISNKIESIYPPDFAPKVTTAPLAAAGSQAKPLVIRPLKSPETVQNTATGSQQKIMLFSIGGQLVTQQGVPVTLDNGVLKLMPQAIVQIANQTLTPKQIQQTLAKISQATVPAAGVSTHQGVHHAGNDSTVLVSQPPVSLSTKFIGNTQVVSNTQTITKAELQSRDHTYETPIKSEPKDLQHSSDNSAVLAERKPVRSLDKELENRYITVPNITNTPGGSVTTTAATRSGSGSVQFVLKPMVYSSGYIVCPRMSGDASSPQDKELKVGNATATSVKMEISEPEIKVTTVSEKDARFMQAKSEKKLNVNGERERMETDDGDDDDLLETPLVIDTNDQESNENDKNQGNYTDKEAALNLLRLANQALGSSDEADEKEIDHSGDAAKLGR